MQPPQGLPTDAAVGKGQVWGTRLDLGQPLDVHLLVSDKQLVRPRQIARQMLQQFPLQILFTLNVCRFASCFLQVKSQSQLDLVLLSVSCHSVAHPVNMLQFIDDPSVMLAGPTTGAW